MFHKDGHETKTQINNVIQVIHTQNNLIYEIDFVRAIVIN